jgi:hypothetical protein
VFSWQKGDSASCGVMYPMALCRRIEPPRVYRRVFCSKLRLLFQACSGLHRRPPLLLVAWRTQWHCAGVPLPDSGLPCKTMRGGVVPANPFQGFPIDLADSFPWAEEVDDFCFEQANRAFGQCVVHCLAGDAYITCQAVDNLSTPHNALYFYGFHPLPGRALQSNVPRGGFHFKQDSRIQSPQAPVHSVHQIGDFAWFGSAEPQYQS